MRKCFVFLMMMYVNPAFSQLNDSFADGNFTASPEWRGDVSAFTVNAGKQLQTVSNAAAQTVSLSTANPIAVNAKWEFYVQLNFDPSANNQVRIYLTSDNENLKNSLNGYFIQIGETGSTDSYDLYKQSGTTITRIIDGPAKTRVNVNQLIARIQVTRTSGSLWELKTDITGGTAFISEGTVTDNSFTNSSWFGVHCKYTTTNSDKFIFDDFKIETLITDITPPKLLVASVIDSLTIDALFDEPLDSISAKNKSNYSLNNGYANPVSVSITTDAAKYRLKFTSGFDTGNYVLTVDGIKDRSDNVISGNNTAAFSYVKPYIARRNDLVINEIFADPSPQIDLPSVEFIELLNTTNHTIYLHGWKYADAITTVSLLSDSIKSGQFLILSAKADTAEFKRFGKVLGISPWPSLNNAGDVLKLTSPENKVIDSVAYSDTWYRDAIKKQGGWTLERVDPKCVCQGMFNWNASMDNSGGTPGKQNFIYQANYDQLALKADSIKQVSDNVVRVFFNKHIDISTVQRDKFNLIPVNGNVPVLNFDIEYKQATLTYGSKFSPDIIYTLSVSGISDCSGNVITGINQPLTFRTPALPPLPPSVPERPDTAKIYITEIFADPSPEVGLPLAEFVEIYNPGRDTIDLEGWTFNDPVTKAMIKKVKILPKEYLILCPAADTIQYKAFGRTIGLSPWPSLNNASDQIVLRSFKGRTVDSVSYSDTWYKNVVKKQGGWTLEKIDVTLPNNFYSWVASENLSGGTPGKVNSIAQADMSRLALSVDSVIITSDSTLRLMINMIPDTASVKASCFNLNSIGKAARATLGSNYKQIDLKFTSRFEEDKQYILTVDSLRTSAGIKIDPMINQKYFSIPGTPEIVYSVIINEIFPDPSPQIGLPETEFIELYNTSNSAVSLMGMSYEDAVGTKYTFKKGEIEANGYLIVCSEKDTLSYKSFGKVLGISAWPSLNNDKDILILRNNKGNEFHRVSYNNIWYKNKEKLQGGWSLELIDPQAVCSGSQNWIASINTAGGTPGKQNSVYKMYSANDPLKLVNALLTDSITLQLNFSRPVDSLSASTVKNFKLNNGVGNPISALPVGPDFEQVILKFSSAIARGNTYQITIVNLIDCTGTIISASSSSAEFIYPHRIAKNDIIINEVLFNPRPGGVDFVEIYNKSDKLLDMKDLYLATTNQKDSLISLKQLSQAQFLMQPYSYFVLTTNPDNIKQEYIVLNPTAFIKMSSFPAFNDDTGMVVLISDNSRIDQLNYSEKMHFTLIKNPEGVSLERSSFNRPANEPGNFRSAAASAGYATPGYKNSQYFENIISGNEEVELISKTFSPDNDGAEDVLVLNYRFSKPGFIANAMVYDNRGVLIRKLVRNQTLAAEGSIIWDGLTEFNEKSPVGIYLIYLEVFNLDGTVKKYRKNCVLAARLN